jgi:hypothetical protein
MGRRGGEIQFRISLTSTLPWVKSPRYPLNRRLGGRRGGLDAVDKGISIIILVLTVITLKP